jgi:purine-binding chemotaxis protein CheW
MDNGMSESTSPRQVVVFTLAEEQYALPIKQVQEIIRYAAPRSVASTQPYVRGVLSLRGRIVPIHDLAAQLGVASELSENTKIMIVENQTETAGVIVDDVDEILTIDGQQLEAAPGADSALIDSIAKIGERLVVLLNASAILPSAALADAA